MTADGLALVRATKPMHNRDSLFDWTLPGGTWLGVRTRLSPLLLIVPVLVTLQRWNLRLGLAFGLSLCLAVALQELTCRLIARRRGQSGGEVLLWPLGRMNRPSSAATMAAAGPLTNLLAALLCLPTLWQTHGGWALLNPLRLPSVDFAAHAGLSLLALVFAANWIVFLANLLPAAPLAAGRLLAGLLVGRLGQSLGFQTLYRAGTAVGVGVLTFGLLFQSAWLCALAAVLVVWNVRESMRQQIAETFDESFMGYDFSQGYTSLERSSPPEHEAQPGLLQRWLTRRRLLRDQRQRQKDEQVERQLDGLLDKVHTQGIDSLTDAERRLLKRASARYKGRSKS